MKELSATQTSKVAEVAYETIRAYRKGLKYPDLGTWDDLPLIIHTQYFDLVRYIADHPSLDLTNEITKLYKHQRQELRIIEGLTRAILKM